MAKPRIFVSSTYYDLKYIRAGLEAFITSMGYDAVLFEHGDIPFQFDQTLEESCYKEVENADMFIIIIGGRYGSLTKEENDRIREKPEVFYERLKSVTAKEYGRALERDLATFVFVENLVLAECTFKANKRNKTINYAHADNTLIFELIEIIMSQKRNNFVKGFSTIEDITDWLRDQWAGLFADYLRRNTGSKQLTSLQHQVKNLSEVAETLKRYNEAIINAVGTADSRKIINEEAIMHRIKKAERFVKNDLIEFLVEDFEHVRAAFSPADILEKFEKSSNIQEFMGKIGVSTSKIETINNVHSESAKKDFENLKSEFGDPVLSPGLSPSRSRKKT